MDIVRKIKGGKIIGFTEEQVAPLSQETDAKDVPKKRGRRKATDANAESEQSE